MSEQDSLKHKLWNPVGEPLRDLLNNVVLKFTNYSVLTSYCSYCAAIYSMKSVNVPS